MNVFSLNFVYIFTIQCVFANNKSMEIFENAVLLSVVADETEVSSRLLTRSYTSEESPDGAAFFRGVVFLDVAALLKRPLCKAAYDGDDDRLLCKDDAGRCCLLSRFSS